MIFDEEKTAVRLRLEFGHVALFRALAAQYESWKLPLAIVLIVPMSC
jgi:hypothetical protein